MKKQLLFIIFIFSFLQQSFSQNPLVKQWDYRFGGTAGEMLFTFKQTTDKGYILGGESKSGLGGDKTEPSWGFEDYWIVKIDSSGAKQWDKRFGGTKVDFLFSLQQTVDGGYILGGETKSGISGDKTQSSRGETDYWTVKIDPAGTKLWDKRFGGNSADQLFSLQQTYDGGYILGGCSASDSTGDKSQPSWGEFDFWIVKTNAQGIKQWDKRYGGTFNDQLFSLQQTADGGYILAGVSNSGINGDKTQSNWDTVTVTYDYWVVKTDSVGNKQWDKRFGGTKNDYCYSIDQTNDGGYILGGYSHSGANGDKTQPLWGTDFLASDYWIVKIDSLGNKEWDKDFGGLNYELNFGNVIQTHDFGYLMAGSSYSNSGGNKTEDNLGQKQVWVIKTDSIGTQEWDKTIFTNSNDYTGYAIQTSDECYAIASFNNSGIAGYKTQPPWSSVDYWIIKFCDSTATTAITQLPNTQLPFSIYPNPAKESLVISDKRPGKKEIEIYDLFGRTVFESATVYGLSSMVNGHSSITIDVSKLAPGIYFLKAGNEVRKFVKK